jgi:hypothetical protein
MLSSASADVTPSFASAVTRAVAARNLARVAAVLASLEHVHYGVILEPCHPRGALILPRLETVPSVLNQYRRARSGAYPIFWPHLEQAKDSEVYSVRVPIVETY